MNPQERESRSRLKPYVFEGEMVRGTLTSRARVCGKPNCRCTRGQKHVSLFLSRSTGGKSEQLYIPAEHEEEVRRWVENWHQVQGLLERISQSYWERLERKE